MSTIIRKLLQEELGQQDYSRFIKFIWEEVTESCGGTPEHEALKKVWEAISDDETYDNMCLRKYGTNSFQYHCVDAKVQELVDSFCSEHGYSIVDVWDVHDVLGPDLEYIFTLNNKDVWSTQTELRATLHENQLLIEVRCSNRDDKVMITMETELYDVIGQL